MQSKSTFADDLANLFTNAVGAAKGVGDEIKAAARSRTDELIANMDLVGREEFEVLKARLDKLTSENAALKAELAALKPAKKASAKKPVAKATTAKKTTAKKSPAKGTATKRTKKA